MILNRAREEVEMITLELARTNPDLGFLIVHAESLASVLKTAVDLRAFKLSDPEDQLMIRAYAEKRGITLDEAVVRIESHLDHQI